MTQTRSPICVVVGHVDHGKSSILDYIRETSIVKEEAGGITQNISSTTIPIKVIREKAGPLLEDLKLKITLPGLLFLDTPGHAAFNNLRKRGGNLADIAILVIDVNEGIKPQTVECFHILKQYKTPFVIALNKIDTLPGWRTGKGKLLDIINSQPQQIQELLDEKLYLLVGRLFENGFQADRFDRITEYTKQIAIIPVSAKSGEGIPELLMMITGLAQKYLAIKLQSNLNDAAKGTVLEVKEEKGLGTTLDVIIYDGTLNVNDVIVIGGLDEPIVSKVKALFEPGSIKDRKLSKYKSVNNVKAAVGVKISGPGLEKVFAGMPIQVATNNLDKIKKLVQKEVKEVLISTDKKGVVVKADSLGSLEALLGLLKENKIPIKKASIGNISKKDINDALSEKEDLLKVILGFNVKGFETKEVKIITNDVIYRIIEDYLLWKEEHKKSLEAQQLEFLRKPAKIFVLIKHVFRQSNPAVFGIEVLEGTLKRGPLIKSDASKAGEIKDIQLESKSVNEITKDKQGAISVSGIIMGRQVKEEDTLYSDINENEYRKLKELQKYLNSSEIKALKEIAIIKRKQNPLWGI